MTSVMQKSLRYDKAGVVADLIIQAATVRINAKRNRLKAEAWRTIYADADGNMKPLDQVTYSEDDILILFYTMPELIACTTGTITVDGQAVEWQKFDVFCDLPGELGDLWADTCREVNPSWYPDLNTGEQEKKILN